MAISTSWIHGNALSIQSPITYAEDGVTERGRLHLMPEGPGASVLATHGGEASWLHLAIPTVNSNISRFQQFELLRVFLLFECWGAQIKTIHVYDGRQRIGEFENLWLGSGPYYLAKRRENTFNVERPYALNTGVGLSFLFTVDNPRQTERVLWVAAAGAEFQTRNVWVYRR